MQTDSLLYRFFKELPSCFFVLVGRKEADAGRYDFAAIEYKMTAVRTDGVFVPKNPAVDPAYLVEVQFYRSENVYSNLLTKIGLFLEQSPRNQKWIAVVIYPNRKTEQKNLDPYNELLETGRFVRIYLNELPAAEPDQFALRILDLIATKEAAALAKAKSLIPRLRKAKLPRILKQSLLEFILTVMVYKLPKMSREEIENMFEVTDIRQTRVFQEILEEGREEGRETVARNLLRMAVAIPDIAEATGLTPSQIRKLSKKSQK